jgi:LmbE family N-acetylglucosaminyl deacetylase
MSSRPSSTIPPDNKPNILRRLAKRLLFHGLESFWGLGFRLLGWCQKPKPAQWTTDGRQCVWVLAPHPDDEAIGCAGVILLHRQAGDEVRVLYISDGGASRAHGLTRDQMVHHRHMEAIYASQLMGVSGVEWLAAPEGAWQVDDLYIRLQTLLEEVQPTIIYAPSCVDYHPEHRKTAHLLAQALGPEANPCVRVYQVQTPLTRLLVNLVADIAPVAEFLPPIFITYATQQGNLPAVLRARRYNMDYYGAGRPVEIFWELTAAQFCRLHQTPADQWQLGAFRSLRHRPYSDPLAYLWGRTARARLRQALQEADHANSL